MLNSNKIKLNIVRCFYPVAVRYWKHWSSLYRVLFERKFKKFDLEANLPLKVVESRLATLSWRADGPKQLWDACGTPNKVQFILNEIKKGLPQPDMALDCDDFSVWAANVLSPMCKPRIYTFAWVDAHGQIEGHAMCLCTDVDGKIFHVGNWGTSSTYNNLKEACEHICARRNAEPIGWALFTKELRLIKCGKGFPNTVVK